MNGKLLDWAVELQALAQAAFSPFIAALICVILTIHRT